MHINAGFSNEAELNKLKDFLYEEAKSNKCFTGIMEAAANEVVIITAVHNIKSNKGSKTPGIDNRKMDKYLQMPKEEMLHLVQMTLMDYKPKPAKRIYIKKSNGKDRPLGIPTVLDRIVQECIRIIIEPICEAKFYPHSYGFRPYRAQKHAVRDIVNIINGSTRAARPPVFALEGDIKGCFDNINHRILLQKLWKMGIHDKRLLKVISQMLKAGYVEYDIFRKSEIGTGQGSILSPLLSNVYLNDFDWYVGRKYYHPHSGAISQAGARSKLRYHGICPKYNIRFADDWVILTTEKREAQQLKKELAKYFRYRLKLELSEEKTQITDMTKNGVKFLGFDIRVEKSKNISKHGLGKQVAKPLPDMEKLGKKIRNLCAEIRKIKTIKSDYLKVAQIEYVNSIIIGIAEYIKTGVSSHAFNAIDYHVNETSFAVWSRMFPDTYRQMKIPVCRLSNLPQRHEGYETKVFAIYYQGKWIGITLAFLTHVKYEAKPFCQKMTPFTSEGRLIYKNYRNKTKPLPRERPALYTPNELKLAQYNKGIRNFEYFMNREYAFNRDKFVCRCCKKPLYSDPGKECHHVQTNLPMSKINKVSNLAWLCRDCHKMVHNKPIPDEIDHKTKKKILNFREKLEH